MIHSIPTEVKAIIQALNNAGFEAYIVGGAVRDILLNRQPQDFDIATAAWPNQVIAVCKEQGWRMVDKLGHNFGVVTVLVEHRTVEVATFRGERYGKDAHRPEAVWYEQSLSEDLARRDFTMNAMALSLSGAVIDPFHGQQDLANRLIRTVGDARRRFREDALRMFRACRFAAQLGFHVDRETLAAMPGLSVCVGGLALERVKSELNLILLADQPAVGLNLFVQSGLAAANCRLKQHGEYRTVAILPELADLVGVEQNPRYHVFDVWNHSLAAVHKVAPNLTLRWSALLHDVAKGRPGVRGINETGQWTDYGHDEVGAQMAKTILERLNFPVKFVERVSWLVRRHMQFHSYVYGVLYDHNLNSLKRWARKEARSGMFRSQQELTEAFQELNALALADSYATGRGNVNQTKMQEFQRQLLIVLRSMPVNSRELAIAAKSLLPLVNNPKQIGDCLNGLLLRVQDGNLVNTPEELSTAARKKLQKEQESEKEQIRR